MDSLHDVLAQSRARFAAWEPLAELTVTARLLPGERVDGVEFEECRFEGGTYEGSALRNCRFADCAFERCNLCLVDLTDTRLSGCSFVGVKALGVNWAATASRSLTAEPLSFAHCRLDDGTFAGMDLRGATFLDCSLREADFEGADLRGARFAGSDLRGARLARCDLREASLVGATGWWLDPRLNRVEGLAVDSAGAPRMLAALEINVTDRDDAPSPL